MICWFVKLAANSNCLEQVVNANLSPDILQHFFSTASLRKTELLSYYVIIIIVNTSSTIYMYTLVNCCDTFLIMCSLMLFELNGRCIYNDVYTIHNFTYQHYVCAHSGPLTTSMLSGATSNAHSICLISSTVHCPIMKIECKMRSTTSELDMLWHNIIYSMRDRCL